MNELIINSGLAGLILLIIDSKPSLLREYLAPVAANSSGVNAGLPMASDAGEGLIATCVTFINCCG
jgi:hypothetical protein